MNFLQKVKDNLGMYNKRMGRQDECIVNTKALRMLIDDYEKIDSMVRVESIYNEASIPNYHKLQTIIIALYQEENKSTDQIMRTIIRIMDIIIDEDEKYQRTKRYDR